MTWLPTFLNWPTALAATAIAVPALLLLYFLKLRRQERKVSSTLLWRKAVEDLRVNSPFQKLRKNLLLLLQMLALLALLLALANPITFYTPGAALNTVILIDHSASMNAHDGDSAGHTRLDEAKRRATQLVDNLGRGGRAMVIAFDDSAETVQPYTADVPALKHAIDAVRPTDRPTRLKLAYQLADAQAVADADQSTSRQRVFLFSDGRATDVADVSLRGELRYEQIGDAKSKNIGIVSLSARRNFDNPLQVQVFARLANSGPDPVKTDVQLSVSALDPPTTADDFQIRQVKSDLNLAPTRWTDAERQQAEQAGQSFGDSVEFDLDITSGAVIKLEQTNKDGDSLPADDTASVVVPPPKPLSLALVTDGNYFLEKFVNGPAYKDAKTISPADWENNPPKDVDVVIFDRYAPKTAPTTGNYMYIGALPPGLPVTQVKDPQGRAQFLSDQAVLDWKRDDPMLRDLLLSKLFASEVMRLNVPPADTVLVEGDGGPMVVMDHAGRSTNLVVAFDLLPSTWPLQRSFPQFMYNAVKTLAAGSDLSVRESFQPGASPKLPRANLDRAAPNLKAIALLGPVSPDTNRLTLTVPPAGDFALPPLEHVGVYTTDPLVPQNERLAVNLLDETESNLNPADTAPGDNGPAQAVAAARTPLNWWWWLVAAVGVPLLVVEWFVYARRVHA